MPGSLTTYTFKTGRGRVLYLEFEFRLEGVFENVIVPPGPGNQPYPAAIGSGGFYLAWAGIEVWAGGRTTHICSPNTGEDTRKHGFHVVSDGWPPTYYRRFGIQVKMPNQQWMDLYCPAPYTEWYATAQDYDSNGLAVASGHVRLYISVEEFKIATIDTRTPRDRDEYKVRPEGDDPNPWSPDFIGKCDLLYAEGPCSGTIGGSVRVGARMSTFGIPDVPSHMYGPDGTMHRPILRLYGHSLPHGGGGMGGGTRTQRITAARIYDRPLFRNDRIDFTHIGNSARPPGLASCTGDDLGNITMTHTEQEEALGARYLLHCECEPKREIAIDGLVTRGFEPNYAAPVTLRQHYGRDNDPVDVTVTDGVHKENVDQRYTDCYWETCVYRNDAFRRENIPLSGTRRRDTYLRTYLKDAWLVGRNEDRRDWRIMAADDFAWLPMNWQHRATVSIDPCNGPTGWTPTNCTLGGTTTLIITPTSSGAQATKSFALPSSEHRYVRVRARASRAATMQVHIEGADAYSATYTLRLTDEFQLFDLDLCVPPGRTAKSDLTDSSWVVPGQYYGPRRITRITLSDMAVGTTFEVDDISFRRLVSAAYTMLPPYEEKVVGVDGHARYRMAWGLVDGRQCCDMPYRIRLHDRDDQDTFLSMSQFKANLDATGAYTTELYGPPDGSERAAFYYANNHPTFGSREACWLAAETYPGGVRTNWNDMSVPVVEPRALMLFDTIWVYPGIGNPVGARSARFPYRYTKRLQTIVHGLTCDVTNARAADNERVTLKLGANIEQVKISDARGYHRTDPFAWRRQGASRWTIETDDSGPVDISSTSALQQRLNNRKFRWVGLLVEDEVPPQVVRAQALECDSPRGLLYLARNDSAIATLRQPALVVHGVSNAHSGIEEWRRIRVHSRQGSIFLLGKEVGSNLSVWRSFDAGETITRILGVDAETALVEMCGATGHLLLFYSTQQGVFYRVSTDHGATWSTPAQVQVGGTGFAGRLLDSAFDSRAGATYLLSHSGGQLMLLASYDHGASANVLLARTLDVKDGVLLIDSHRGVAVVVYSVPAANEEFQALWRIVSTDFGKAWPAATPLTYSPANLLDAASDHRAGAYYLLVRAASGERRYVHVLGTYDTCDSFTTLYTEQVN